MKRNQPRVSADDPELRRPLLQTPRRTPQRRLQPTEQTFTAQAANTWLDTAEAAITGFLQTSQSERAASGQYSPLPDHGNHPEAPELHIPRHQYWTWLMGMARCRRYARAIPPHVPPASIRQRSRKLRMGPGMALPQHQPCCGSPESGYPNRTPTSWPLALRKDHLGFSLGAWKPQEQTDTPVRRCESTWGERRSSMPRWASRTVSKRRCEPPFVNEPRFPHLPAQDSRFE